jgi:hypothetical protein
MAPAPAGVRQIDPAAIETVFREVSGLGFHGLELFGWQVEAMEAHGGIGPLIEKYQLPLIGTYGGPNLTDPNQRQSSLDQVVAVAKLVKKYGGKVIVFGPNGVNRANFVFADHKTNIITSLPDIFAVRPGAGVGGADRVTFIWNTQTPPKISNRWLQVTVNGATLGLPANDVFYYGNQIGEGSGGTAGSPDFGTTAVGSNDQLGARENPRNAVISPAPVDFVWDFNKDKAVGSTDKLIARESTASSPLFRLGLFTALGAGPLTAGALTDDGGGALLVSALTDGGWSELGSDSAGESSAAGASSAADERIWDEDAEELSAVGASDIDAALEDDNDWLDSGWETL